MNRTLTLYTQIDWTFGHQDIKSRVVK